MNRMNSGQSTPPDDEVLPASIFLTKPNAEKVCHVG